MNLKNELTKKQQNLMEQLDIPIENREYSRDELRNYLDVISNNIMNFSLKNGDLQHEMTKYNELANVLEKNC